jgi:hypothetical protein
MIRTVTLAATLLSLASTATPALAHPVPHGQAAAHSQSAAMSAAAQAFIASLDQQQRQALLASLDDEAARTDWSNLPAAIYPRSGLAVGDLSDAQRLALHDLLASAMSGEGYGEATTIMWIDDLLREIEAQRLAAGEVPEDQRATREQVMQSRGSGNYWLRLFGDPADGPWGWMINGHHFAANFTVVDGRTAFTPLFLGANPQIVQSGPYTGWRVLDHEISSAFALMASLDAEQRAAALVGDAVEPAAFAGKGAKDLDRSRLGLSAERLSPEQSERLLALVEDFVGFANDDAAAAQLAAIRADGVGALHLAWWGSPEDPSQRFMYRIEGPSILIDYVREGNPDGSPQNHVHAIVRDPRNDYGEGWLSRHYSEVPHP